MTAQAINYMALGPVNQGFVPPGPPTAVPNPAWVWPKPFPAAPGVCPGCGRCQTCGQPGPRPVPQWAITYGGTR